MIVHAVEGLEPGAYALDQDGMAIEMIKAGEFRREAGYLGLEQALPAEAAATIFFIADLNAVFGRFGNRGAPRNWKRGSSAEGRIWPLTPKGSAHRD